MTAPFPTYSTSLLKWKGTVPGLNPLPVHATKFMAFGKESSMKKLSATLFVLLLAAAATASAQVLPGKFELGTSVSYYNLKFDSEESSLSYLSLPLRFGWYIWAGLELEPEVQIFVPMGDAGGDMTYLAQGKLLYNIAAGKKLEFFLGGGAGAGNGLPIYGVIEGGSDYKSFAYVGLAGVKVRVGKSAALRVEYRFNRFNWTHPLATAKEWGNLHQVLIGVSLFL